MTERRPHWDDDLITAVCATGSYSDGEVDYWMTSDQVYRIIAAVEDWEKETFNAATEVLVERIQKAEAQVQAVRDAIEAELERHTLTNLGDFMFLDQALRRVLRALDGDA